MQFGNFIYKIFLFYFPLLFSLCVHEWAHGWVAKQKGDLTAYHKGRLTLNPVAHIDIMGTLILPLFFIFVNSPLFFGWAKPVPVDESYLKNPKKDMFWIAFAGPLSNFILAGLGSVVLAVVFIFNFYNFQITDPIIEMGKVFIYVNLLLGLFNLIPLHPLDGSKVLARFLPTSFTIFLEKNQNYLSFLLIVLVFSGGFHYLSKPVLFGADFLLQFSQNLAFWVQKIIG